MELHPVSPNLSIAVVEERSLAAAAERERNAAPAVRKRISMPKEVFRRTLLTRHHKAVEPTVADYAVPNLSRRAVNYLDDIHTEMLDYAPGQGRQSGRRRRAA